jgi:hypothetical protein
MKKLVFLISFLTIGCIIKIYPQFPESADTDSSAAKENLGIRYDDGLFEMDPNSNINDDWNHLDLSFTNERNNLFAKNVQEKYSDQQLKALEGEYPGAGGCIDNRMILDSTILYYSHQPLVEGLKVWSSVYDYDSRLNKIEEVNYTWDWTVGSMGKENRYVYAYDVNGNQTEWADYIWNSQINEWVGFWRNVYIYDTRGNLAVLITYGWDSKTKSWVNGWPKVDYTFDASGNLTEKIIYEWGLSKNERIEEERYIYEYDTKKNLTKETCYRWDSSIKSWRGEYRFVYGYDAHWNLKVRISYNWELKTNDWAPSLRDVYSYDGSWSLINEIIFEWNSVSNVWRGIYCYDYYYDSSGNLAERIRKNWNSLTYVWGADERYIYTYDTNGNLTQKTKYYWKPELKNWEEVERLVSSWSYPLINNQAFCIDENCDGCSFLGCITTGSTYNREKITFNLTGGDTDNSFAIDTATGDIFLINPGDLDYEITCNYNLTVEAHFRDSTRFIKQKAEIKIYVNNVNDNVPVVNDTTFSIDEHSDPGTIIGTVIAKDDDGDLNPLTYSIISGNDNNTFQIDNFSGIITLNSDVDLDYETREVYTLIIQVSDNTFTDEAIITINVSDIIETTAVTIKSSNFIKFYPNPATDILYLEVPDNSREGFELEMINLAGQVIFSQSGYTGQIDVSNLQSGIYFVKVMAENNEIITGKVMIGPNPY